MLNRDLSSLTENVYDLIIVGGGIFGVCAAWDAALRGLSVALLERDDFGHATSAHHFKVVHGGIRYLQHMDIVRLRESTVERSALLRIAPHLVHPLPFVIPTYGHRMQSKEVMTAALKVYDILTLDRNQGIRDSKRQIPPGRTISREECLKMFPYLDPSNLTGAVIFHDGQMFNPPRLTLSFVKSAARAGADVANYTEVTSFIEDNNRVTGVKAKDRLTGDEFEVRGRVVLNAAGPWANGLIQQALKQRINPEPVFSRDAYFIVDRPLLGNGHALAVQGQTSDPDAVLSRGKRHLFIVPWQDQYTLLGVWHVVHKGHPEAFTVTEPELQSFLDEMNGAYPGLRLTLEDVSMWSAGLTLFGENKPGAKNLSYGKRSMLIDHARDYGKEGLITLIGVRFTTARGMAVKAVDLAFNKLGKKPPHSKTAVTPLYGGEIETFDDAIQQATKHRPPALSAEIVPHLVHNHGTAYQEVTSLIDKDASLAETIGKSQVIKAEVIHAVRNEMALQLGDVVFRRTDLGTGRHPGDAALHACADLMAAELGWDQNQKQQQLAEVQARFPHL